eukprot:scaffold8700_cov31-Tisochrysis_lutea.AAC.14
MVSSSFCRGERRKSTSAGSARAAQAAAPPTAKTRSLWIDEVELRGRGQGLGSAEAPSHGRASHAIGQAHRLRVSKSSTRTKAASRSTGS